MIRGATIDAQNRTIGWTWHLSASSSLTKHIYSPRFTYFAYKAHFEYFRGCNSDFKQLINLSLPPHNQSSSMFSLNPCRNVLVTGANGYIGNAVARAFVRAGWTAHGLVRSASGAQALAVEEILPIIGSIDDLSSHDKIASQLPSTVDTIVSVTEDWNDYVAHYNNIVALLRTISAISTANGVVPLVIFTSGCKDYGVGPHFANDPKLAPHMEESPLNPPAMLQLRTNFSRKIFEHVDAFLPVLYVLPPRFFFLRVQSDPGVDSPRGCVLFLGELDFKMPVKVPGHEEALTKRY